jgi:hypothetical protein
VNVEHSSGDVPPVRGFRWNKGDRSFPGWYYAVTTGGHVDYESWLERDRLILLDVAPGRGADRPPAVPAALARGDELRRHAPDHFVPVADGRNPGGRCPHRGPGRRTDCAGVRHDRAPKLAYQPRRRFRNDAVLIVDGEYFVG